MEISNGHNPLWGSNRVDNNGRIIGNLIDKHRLVCISNGEGTRINQGTTSCIDITLTSPDLAKKCTWTTLEEAWGSDHHPIMIEYMYNQRCLYTIHKPIPRWSIKKANWDKFQTACNEHITEPNTTTNAEEAYNTFIDQLTEAINSSIPKTNPTKSSKTPTSWWNEDCKEVVTNRKMALRILEKTRHPDDLVAYK